MWILFQRKTAVFITRPINIRFVIHYHLSYRFCFTNEPIGDICLITSYHQLFHVKQLMSGQIKKAPNTRIPWVLEALLAYRELSLSALPLAEWLTTDDNQLRVINCRPQLAIPAKENLAIYLTISCAGANYPWIIEHLRSGAMPIRLMLLRD